jgi:hypothetical protein
MQIMPSQQITWQLLVEVIVFNSFFSYNTLRIAINCRTKTSNSAFGCHAYSIIVWIYVSFRRVTREELITALIAANSDEQALEIAAQRVTQEYRKISPKRTATFGHLTRKLLLLEM